MDNHRSKEKLTKIITEKPELLQNLNISPRKLLLFVEHLENNNVVVREKGEWIKQEGAWRMMESGESVNIHLCSCCGGYFQNAPYNFCPACGADMREEN